MYFGEKITPLTLVTVDFSMICRNAKPKLLISTENNFKFQLHFNFGLRKMFAVMAFFDQFDHNKLYNSAFVLFFFFSESRKFHAMARALPDAIKSAARQISRMLSPFRFD